MSADLEQLLAVQEADTAADVLRHRKEALPEREELAARHAALAAVDAEAAPLHEERHRLGRSQQALEDEITLVAEKAAGVDKAMYRGSISNPRELQAMQEEIEALGRRRAALEDQVLELMVEAEPLDAALEALAARRRGIDEEAVALTASLAEAEAVIDGELADVEGRRLAAAESVDGDLLARYEKLRTRLRGVGVARLEGGRCLGCHLALPAAEIEAVKREARDEGVATCPQCDRLLVV